MYKIIAFFTLACALPCCISTRIDVVDLSPMLTRDSKILVLPALGTSEEHSRIMYEELAEGLDDHTDTTYYLADVEYQLITSGVGKNLWEDKLTVDSAMASTFSDHLKIDYIVQFEVLYLKNGSGIVTYFAEELEAIAARNYIDDKEENVARVNFHVYDLEASLRPKSFLIETSIGPISLPGSDGGETRINLASEYSALYIAIKKGCKKLRREMVNQ